MLRYKLRDKKARNKVIVKYRKDFPDTTLEELGQMFGISRQRVYQILKLDKGKV